MKVHTADETFCDALGHIKSIFFNAYRLKLSVNFFSYSYSFFSHPVKTLLQYYGKSLEVLPTPVSGTTAAP